MFTSPRSSTASRRRRADAKPMAKPEQAGENRKIEQCVSRKQ
jgi:hypothetical protein